MVIDEDFSYNMYHMLTEWTGKPTITYYENYKKNAVATKITDTAVSSLKTTISTTKTYEPGTSVSYGRLFTTQRRTRMGVVPTLCRRVLPVPVRPVQPDDRQGARAPAGPHLHGYVHDRSDGSAEVQVGDEVEIFGPRNPVEVMAAQAGDHPL